MSVRRFYTQSELLERGSRRLYFICDSRRHCSYGDAIVAGDTQDLKTAERWAAKLNAGKPIKSRYLTSYYRHPPFCKEEEPQKEKP